MFSVETSKTFAACCWTTWLIQLQTPPTPFRELWDTNASDKNRQRLKTWGVENPPALIHRYMDTIRRQKRLLGSLFCIYFRKNSTYGLRLGPKCLTMHFFQWACLISIFQTGQSTLLVISYNCKFKLSFKMSIYLNLSMKQQPKFSQWFFFCNGFSYVLALSLPLFLFLWNCKRW